jgi:CubicO group peptidase (beta-lactamase class C family)
MLAAKRTILGLALAAWTMTASAQSPAAIEGLPQAKPEDVGMSSARLARIGDVLDQDVKDGKLPGAVLAIARNGKLVFMHAYGYRDKATNSPMTTDTIFNIASMTKPMTTVGALTLVEQGKLVIDEPVTKYLPQYFAAPKVATLDETGSTIVSTHQTSRAITIRDLLTHTSGLIYGGRGATAVHKLYPASSVTASQELTSSEFLAKLSGAPLLYQPGTTWDYGFGLDVTGLIEEALTKESLGTYLSDVLFKPLGMKDTGFVIPTDKIDRYAKALPTDPDTGRPQTLEPDATRPAKFECGGGCAVSTAGDYLRFASMLLNHGTFDGHRVLSPKMAEYMVTNQLGPNVRNLIGNADPTRTDYGFGLGLAVRTTPGIVHLLGSVGDFTWPGASGTNWWVDPQEHLAVVFMAHTPGTARWHYRYLINTLVYQALDD